MERIFLNIYQRISAHKKWALLVLIAVILGLAFVASQLKFEEDISKLIPENEEARLLNKVLDQVDFADKIVVHVKKSEQGTTPDLTGLAAALVTRLNDSITAPFVKDIQGQVDEDDFEATYNFVYTHLPLFLAASDYKDLAASITVDALDERTKNNYKTLVSPSGIIAKRAILKDPLGLTLKGLDKLKALQLGDDFGVKDGFVISKDEKNILLFIKPTYASNETDKNTRFVALLNTFQNELNTAFEGKARVQYYGATLVAVANAKQIKHDIQLTVSIAMTVLLIILILFYKKIYLPLILFIPTALGALLAIAVLYVSRGTISAISIGIGSVLLGITLDYALHILTHYRNCPDVNILYKDVAKPIVMSSITTALAFLCLLFIKSRALQDLGIFAAVSVIGAAVFALILLPHLYRVKNVANTNNTVLDRWAAIRFGKSKGLLFLCLGLFIVSLFTYNQVLFDKDISKLNYQPESLQAVEQELNSLINTESKSLYVVSYGDRQDDALAYNQGHSKLFEKLKAEQKLVGYSTVAGVVLDTVTQRERIKQWQLFWGANKEMFKERLIASGTPFGFKPETFNQFYDKINTEYQLIDINTYASLKAIPTQEFLANKKDFYTVLASLKVANNLITEVKNTFRAEPHTVVIDRQEMNETFLSTFKDDFNTLLGYSFIAVLIILWLFFRRIELVVITMLPIALTWLVTIGMMGVLGLSFNIFNIIISTFIFGLGIDYAIFMTNGLMKSYETGKETLPTYRASIILSVITTILGIGVLIFAKHPALKSISIVSLIGIITAMLITFIIQPRLFRGLITNRAKKGLAPITFRKLLHAIFSFLVYGLGGMILTLFAVTILQILPIKKKRKFKWLHGVMAKLMTTVLYTNPFVKKRMINNGEQLDTPAVIIANHTSFLDTLALSLFTPKIIYLVNDWVYNSPIFGKLARIIGYYPVSQGVDGSLGHVKKKVEQGYSVVVFPEGKRMYSNKIGRFHKGAFYLAEELGLPIIPAYIHGNSEVLPKGDFIINDGSITVEIGERIHLDDPNLGDDVKAKTKAISKQYKNNFQVLRNTWESASYFRKKVLQNFDFKSAEIYDSVKNDIVAREALYDQLRFVIPLKCKLLHIANDYGALDILLKYQSNERKIQSYICDEQKRLIAKNNFVGRDHKIDYIDVLEESKPAEVLLVTTAQKEDAKKSSFDAFNMVVVFDHVQENIELPIAQFEREERNGITIWRRKTNGGTA